jgi:hypothetical protein
VVDGHIDSHTPTMGGQVRDKGGSAAPIGPSTSELVQYDPPKAWTVRGIDGPIRAAVDVVVDPVGDSRSLLTISVDFADQGIGKILVPLMVRRKPARRCRRTRSNLRDDGPRVIVLQRRKIVYARPTR